MAAALQARGVEPGTHVAVLGPTSRALVTAIQAIWLAGATVVALPLPMRLGSIEEFVEQTRRRIAHADAARRARRPRARAVPRPAARATRRSSRLDELVAEARARAPAAACGPPTIPTRSRSCSSRADRPSDPKGVMLPDRCIIANIDAIVEAAGIDARRPRGVVAAAVPRHGPHRAADDADAARASTSCSARRRTSSPRPASWLEWISEFRGTITAGPNFSYALAARALRRAERRSTCRRGGSRSTAPSPSTPRAVEAFCAAGAPHGLDAKAAFCVFGMAEATLAVTFPELGARHGRRHRRPRRARARARTPRPRHDGRDGTAGSRCSAVRCAASSCASCDPDTGARRSATARSASSSSAARR